MRVLWFNLAMDRRDPALGFAVRWVEEAARRVERVDVVTMLLGEAEELPSNVGVWSVGKEKGWSEPRRFMEFRRILRGIDRSGRPDVVFAHMMPLFVVLASPWARRRGVPQVLWYAHGAVPLRLRLAARRAARILTSTPGGCRLRRPPARALGQGIELDRFTPIPRARPDREVRVLVVGRISPSKRIDLSIEAVRRAAAGSERRWLLEIVGAPATRSDRAYEARMRRLAGESALEIRWRGPVAHAEMPSVYRAGDLLLNLSATGSLDKVLLEAMATGCLPVSSNDSFRREISGTALECLRTAPDPAAAAAKLREIVERPDLEDLRIRARRWVEERHGLEGLMDRIVEELRMAVEEARGK